MKVLVTGAPGFVGSRVVDLLLAEGDEVTGLARNDARAEGLKAKGVTPLVADLRDADTIANAASQADAVIHLGFIHDFAKMHESLPVELKLVQAILDALRGTNKAFIGTSGSALLPETDGPVNEDYPLDPSDPVVAHGRHKAEKLMVEAAQSGVRTAIIRLPPYVFDEEGAAFSKIQDGKAQQQGIASYIADGSNPSPNTYVVDAAQAYLLALHHAKPGALYHVTSGSATHRQIAEAIAAKHGLKTQSISMEEAVKLYGPFLSSIFAKRNLPDSTKAKTELHWQPKHDNFLECVAGKA